MYEQVLMVPWIASFSNSILLSNSIPESKTARFGIESTNWTLDNDDIWKMDVKEAILREARAIYDRTAEKADQRERMTTMEKQMKETVDKVDKVNTKLDTKLAKLDTKLDEILQAILAAPPVGAEAAGLLPGQPS